LVVNVARGVADTWGNGVLVAQRPGGGCVVSGECRLGTVGDDDENPGSLGLHLDAPAEVGGPGRPAEGGERAEARRLRQSVVHEMGERQVAQTSRGEPLEVFQRALEVVPAFGRMDHRQAPGVEHLAHAAAWGQAHSVGSAGAEILDELHRAHGGSEGTREDRKSTRLNSSHLVISYAVFCLKKKKRKKKIQK